MCELVLQKPVAIEPDNPQVLRLLSRLSGLDLDKVMAKRREPLVVPHYQLMSLEELEQVSLLAVFVIVSTSAHVASRGNSKSCQRNATTSSNTASERTMWRSN